MRSLLFALVWCSIASAQDVKPIWIVRDEPAPTVNHTPADATLRAGLMLGAVLSAGALLAWRRREQDPLEAAYHRVATHYGLDSDDRAVIRELGARAPGISPVALLMSESALQRELLRARRRTIDPGHRARLNRVEAKVLG